MNRKDTDTLKDLNAQLDMLSPEELDALAAEGRKLGRNQDRQREYMRRYLARQALIARMNVTHDKAVK